MVLKHFYDVEHNMWSKTHSNRGVWGLKFKTNRIFGMGRKFQIILTDCASTLKNYFKKKNFSGGVYVAIFGSFISRLIRYFQSPLQISKGKHSLNVLVPRHTSSMKSIQL